MRVSRYVGGFTPASYRKLTYFDRLCVNDSLDTLLSRENGEKADGEPTVDAAIEREAEAAARLEE